MIIGLRLGLRLESELSASRRGHTVYVLRRVHVIGSAGVRLAIVRLSYYVVSSRLSLSLGLGLELTMIMISAGLELGT